uniref:Uncharacterized protein n=1 Tax=Oryza nivara TaxID=4536 RepID=A0A0E0HAG8_ORYNI
MGGSSGGGSLCPISPSSRSGSGYGGGVGGGRIQRRMHSSLPLFSLRRRRRQWWRSRMDSVATAEGGAGDGYGWIRRQASEIL